MEQIGAKTSEMSSLTNGVMFKCSMPYSHSMEPFELAWERQPNDRQWKKPEGDDPRTLYQMLMTSVGRFGDLPCFGYIPAPGMPRTHISYNQFGELATSVGTVSYTHLTLPTTYSV